MKAVLASQMRQIEEKTIKEMGMPSIILMEQAAMAVVEECLAAVGHIKNPQILIVAGQGNNGGDGLAIARILFSRGINTGVICFGEAKEDNSDYGLNLKMVLAMGIPVKFLSDLNIEFIDVEYTFESCDLIVDAIFGTGLERNVEGLYASIIHTMNDSGKEIIAVDIPSGIHCDSGKIMGLAVRAKTTVSFEFAKQGLLLFPGRTYAGKILVKQISVPENCKEYDVLRANYLTDDDAKDLSPGRNSEGHKGTFGKVGVVAGSPLMPGSAGFVCRGAYSVGAGVVYLYSADAVRNVVIGQSPEVVGKALAVDTQGLVTQDSIDGVLAELATMDVVVLGPGIGRSEGVTRFVVKAIEKLERILILDADAVNAIEGATAVLKNTKAKIIVTPHIKEMSRLTGIDAKEIKDNMIEVATRFSIAHRVVTVLKDARSIVSDVDGEYYINTTGTAAMAKAGSGDVLSGVIGGLCAQKMNIFHAAALGAYIHGKAGEYAEAELGSYGVFASDLVSFIRQAMRLL